MLIIWIMTPKILCFLFPFLTILSIFSFRNKEEGYFLASELLKKICSNQKGVEALRNLPALLKRLHNLTEDLSRKANNEKRFGFGHTRVFFHYTN